MSTPVTSPFDPKVHLRLPCRQNCAATLLSARKRFTKDPNLSNALYLARASQVGAARKRCDLFRTRFPILMQGTADACRRSPVVAARLAKPRPTRQAAGRKEKSAVGVEKVDSSLVREGAAAGSKLNLCTEFDAPSEGAVFVTAIAQISERVIPVAVFAFPKTVFRAANLMRTVC
jgi:hypothetical protein